MRSFSRTVKSIVCIELRFESFGAKGISVSVLANRLGPGVRPYFVSTYDEFLGCWAVGGPTIVLIWCKYVTRWVHTLLRQTLVSAFRFCFHSCTIDICSQIGEFSGIYVLECLLMHCRSNSDWFFSCPTLAYLSDNTVFGFPLYNSNGYVRVHLGYHALPCLSSSWLIMWILCKSNTLPVPFFKKKSVTSGLSNFLNTVLFCIGSCFGLLCSATCDYICSIWFCKLFWP